MSSKLKKIIIIAFCAVIVVTAVLIPSISYAVYRDSIKVVTPTPSEETPPEEEPEPAAQLQSIEATLADGVAYYKYGYANVEAEDISVTAHYSDGTSAVVEDGYIVSVDDDFAKAGGKITVFYGTKTCEVNVTLEDVEVERLEMTKRQNTVEFAKSAEFTADGMEVTAVYNCGKTVVLAPSDYEWSVAGDTSTFGDKKAVLTYGGVTLDVPYTVSESVENGDPTKLIVSEGVVEAGEKLSQADISVAYEYANGNRVPVETGSYTVTGSATTATLGNTYAVNVEAGGLTATAVVKVSDTIVMETDKSRYEVVGSSTVGGYDGAVLENGELKKTGSSVMLLRGFHTDIDGAKESALTLIVDNAQAGNYDIVIDGTTNFVMRQGESPETFVQYALQLNMVATMSVNGTEVPISDDVVQHGYYDKEIALGSERLMLGLCSDMVIRDVPLVSGENRIKFDFRAHNNGYRCVWTNNVAPMIRSCSIVSSADAPADGATLEGVDIGAVDLKLGASIDSLDIPVLATYSDGSALRLTKDAYSLSVKANGSAASGTVQPDTTYEITVSVNGTDFTKTVSVKTGKITAINFADSSIVYYDDLSELTVLASMNDGSTFVLDKSQYSLSVSVNGEEGREVSAGERAGIGASYTLTATYNGDPALTAEVQSDGVISVMQFEDKTGKNIAEYVEIGSQFVSKGKGVQSAYETVLEDGTFKATDTAVSYLGSFDANDGNGMGATDGERYVKVNVTVEESGTYALTIRVSDNLNLRGFGLSGGNTAGGWSGANFGGERACYLSVKDTVSGTALNSDNLLTREKFTDVISDASAIDMTNAVSGVSASTYQDAYFVEFTMTQTVDLEAGHTYEILFDTEKGNYFPDMNMDWVSLEKV